MPSRSVPNPISASSRCAGLVLAAGASERMGSPKALLQTPDGIPLAKAQADLLSRAGCDPVTVVIGADAARIREEVMGCPFTVHEGWRAGRVSSLQAGLRALPPSDAYVILPVDAVGIAQQTVESLLCLGASSRAQAIRPSYRERAGHLLWISAATADEILHLMPAPETRLNAWIDPKCMWVEMEDPALLHNLNTPDDWAGVYG